MAPQQLMLEMIRGSRHYALLPEPFLSLLLAKKPDIRIIASLEKEFAHLTGGTPRLPLAGIAVNTAFAKAHPEMLKKLVRTMQIGEIELASNPKKAIAVLPAQVLETLGADVIEASLARDPIHIETASQAREKIADFLQMIAPEWRKPLTGEMPSDSFIFLPQ
jgi:NitT/TauT family transport system substrate-binding protein